MARYFTLASTRGDGIARMMEKAKTQPDTSITLYAAAGSDPTFYLVGETVADAVDAGMLPVFTFMAHSDQRGLVQPHERAGECICWADREREAR